MQINASIHLRLYIEEPAYLKNVKANIPILIHIGVKAWRIKLDNWWLEGVISGEFETEFVGQSIINSPQTTFNCTNPGEYIVSFRKSRNTRITACLDNEHKKILNT